MPPDRHALVFMFLRVFVSTFTRVSCRHSNEICRRTTLEQKMFPQREAALDSRDSQLFRRRWRKNSIAPWEKTFEWWGSRAEKNTLSIIHSRSLIIMRMLGILSYEPLHRRKILLFTEFWVKKGFSIVWPSAPLLPGRSSHSGSSPLKIVVQQHFSVVAELLGNRKSLNFSPQCVVALRMTLVACRKLI